MATRLTQKTAFTGNTAKEDLYMIVDESDNTGSADGTSKKITSEQVIQTTKVNITSSNFGAMDNTGVAGTFFELLPAPGTGLFYAILSVSINTLVTSPPNNNTNLYIGYDSTQISSFVLQSRRFNNNISSRSYNLAPLPQTFTGAHLGILDAKPLVVYANQNFNGNISADFYVTYRKCSI
tara:strand:+ start:215 stop:754 length:540 start_codon:yes stop_codon:yes gene_type:complete